LRYYSSKPGAVNAIADNFYILSSRGIICILSSNINGVFIIIAGQQVIYHPELLSKVVYKNGQCS